MNHRPRGLVRNVLEISENSAFVDYLLHNVGFLKVTKAIKRHHFSDFCGHLAQNWGDRMPHCKCVISRSQSKDDVLDDVHVISRALLQKRRQLFSYNPFWIWPCHVR